MKLILSQIEYDKKSEVLDFTSDSKIVFSAKKELEIMDNAALNSKAKNNSIQNDIIS